MKTLTILGSTGSIGVSTLDVVRRHLGRYRIAALCAHHGAAQAVRGVFFDTKWQGFNIDANPAAEGGLLHQVIQRCAEQSLPQLT